MALSLPMLLLFGLPAHAVSWFPFGPDGGDARSLAVDPHDHAHLFLGTTTGWIYESHTEGQEWKRLARVGRRDDLVLDNIVVDKADSKHLVVGAFVVGSADGGVFVSKDGGVSWSSQETLRGQSIRALAQSASDSKLWIAGTLTGVQRSEDNGEHWRLISPEGSTEIHEVESVAIDPKDPKVIYAGTWHLPWKTTDGGATWNNIKEGVIDDSDVFSIIVDAAHPNTVYASACSGIYKSDDAGARFQKVEGIPSTARRTRVLEQDPKNPNIVFAGTTEGLWRTSDAGKIWLRMTGPEVIVNDVYVDPADSNKLLVATDRGGVLYSNDGGTSFRPSNKGFSARHLSSFVADAQHPATIYVGALNDKQWGGVFTSDNGGLSWAQRSDGLGGSDIFSLGQAPDGTILAGTGHGIYLLKDNSWSRVADVAFPKTVGAAAPHSIAKSVVAGKSASRKPVARKSAVVLKPFDGAVYAMALNGNSVFAASSQGLLVSDTSGVSWKSIESAGSEQFYFLTSVRSEVLAAGLKVIKLSKDSGQSWKTVIQPSGLVQLTAAAIDGDGGLWAAGSEGVFLSQDDGASWQSLPQLFVNDVNSIYFDARADRVLITNGGKGTIAYSVHLPEKKVSFWDTGWNLRFLRPVGDHLIGVTPFDGVVLQPRMVESAETVLH
ncbi:WD40/YVTN/BNR-like repeat-containing protein [Granulicella arctica]|uniref:WD40/YVTN/BNR-like repeat-containing protein n=1 Tax=Granulicella arctica TaxID=940613 RepID=UPI0021E09F52|nr:hypothetical protein [Granulicella arctica]